jgi:hypothetical protein
VTGSPDEHRPADGRIRPSLADHQAWSQFQATALTRALEDAKAWRNGYAILAGGIGALLGLIGDRLSESTPWQWRLLLTVTFGVALALTALALWLVLTIEGGSRARTVNLREIVADHNSFDMYQADQAAAAVERLGHSRRLAAAGALFAFVGLLITLWLPKPAVASAAPGQTAGCASYELLPSDSFVSFRVTSTLDSATA